MIVTAIAKRYAKALFELAHGKKLVAKILAEFKSFLMLIQKKADLQLVLKHPNDIQREKMLSALWQKQFSELFFNFLLLVLRNKRYDLLPQIFDNFQTRYDTYMNRIRALAITALPLSKNELNKLKRELTKYLHADITIENKVDPSIIGGIIISLNGQVFNASLLEQFKKLKQYLIENQK